jgi:prevent-host-death family protein
MLEIEELETRNKFLYLLDEVERGAEIVITRHGRRIARLVPASGKLSYEQSKMADNRIRERAQRLKLEEFRS